jgi:hypothetical protein
MRVYEILTESTELQEGPILNKIGRGIGKTVGTVAKGVGAVAGGVMGLGRAIKKGYQAGKSTVGGAGDDDEVSTTASTGASGSAPAQASAAPTAQKPNAAAATKPLAAKSKPAASSPAANNAAADSAVIDTPSGKVKLKDIKTAMSSMKPQQVKKIKTAIDARLQKAA